VAVEVGVATRGVGVRLGSLVGVATASELFEPVPDPEIFWQPKPKTKKKPKSRTVINWTYLVDQE
jgi:hypothetical protein